MEKQIDHNDVGDRFDPPKPIDPLSIQHRIDPLHYQIYLSCSHEFLFTELSTFNQDQELERL